MKIAYDAKRFFNNSSGLGNYSRDLVRILAEIFPRNQYLLFNNTISNRGNEILEKDNVSFVKTSGGIFSRQLAMGKDSQRAGADIFHGLSGELPLRWYKNPIKKIVTIHDLIFERFPKYYSFFDRKIHFWKFKKATEQADIVIAISEQTKADIIKFLKIPEEKIVVVYQGCHSAFKGFIFPDFLEKTKAKFSLPDRFLLHVGTIEPRKNLLNVIRALNNTEITLVVIGKKQKNYFKKIESFLKKNKVKVQFLENVNIQELAAVYRLADVFVYTSLFEGFGIPVIEALFSGTPVVTSNLSSLPEAGGNAAIYVDPQNVEDIRTKIQFLWQNGSERNRRRKLGFEYSRKFRDEEIAKDIQYIYNLK